MSTTRNTMSSSEVRPEELRAPTTTTTAPCVTRPRNTLGRAVRSELIKLRTLRANAWLFGVAIAILVVLGPVQTLGSVLAESDVVIRDSASTVATALTGVSTSTLLVGVLGVLLVAGEYAPRTIRTTFMTVPRRRTVVLAKAVALALVVGVAGIVAVAAAVTTSLVVLSHGDLRVSWTSPHVLRVSAATVWYLVGWGVLGLAAGWLTRSKLGGAALLLGVMLVLAPVLGLIPGRVGQVVVAVMPSTAGAAMVTAQPTTADIAGVSVNLPVFGFVVWTAYLVLASVVAAAVASRRDA